MPAKIHFALTACSVIALAVTMAAPGAAAASHAKHKPAVAHHARHVHALSPVYRFDPRNPEGYGVAPPANAIVGPGYIFVPGAGILGESCDLPTSTCPNAYRDIQ